IALPVPQTQQHLHSCWHGPRLGHRLPFRSPRVVLNFGTYAFSLSPVKAWIIADRTGLRGSYSYKMDSARARICNRHCERFETEQGEPGLFQISGVVLRRGCRRCGSKDSFRIPTPPSAIRAAKTHGPDLTRNI